MLSLRRQVLSVLPAAERVEVQTAIEHARRGERLPADLFNSLTKAELGRVDMHRPECNSGVKRDAEKRMRHMDNLPPDVRAVAHELGFGVVHAFYLAGIKKANTIKHLICMARGLQTDGRPADFGNYRSGSRK